MKGRTRKLSILLACVIGYGLGLIHPSLILSRLKGVNLSESGSKNYGTSNMTIVMGWRYGAFTAFVDILKSAMAFWLVAYFFQDQNLAWLAGVMAIIGHIYPAYNHFKGGKGMASLVGLFIAINPYYGLLAVLFTAILTLITGYIVVPSLILFLCLPICAYALHRSILVFGLTLFIGGLGIYLHRINIVRLYHKEEISLYDLFRN